MGKPPQQLKITFKDDFICVFQSQVHQTVKTLLGEGGDVYGASSNFWYSPLLWCCVYMTMMEESDASHGPNLIHISWKNTIFVCLMFEVWPQCGQSQPVSSQWSQWSDFWPANFPNHKCLQILAACGQHQEIVHLQPSHQNVWKLISSTTYLCPPLFSEWDSEGDGGAACPCWWFLI